MQLATQYQKPQPSLIMTDAMILTAGICLLFATSAMAGTDSTFAAIATWLQSTLTGSLGKVFSLGSLAVGLGIGIVKQSILAVAIGVGMALAASVGPGVLTGIFTAVM